MSQDTIGIQGGNPTLDGYVFDTNLELDVWGLLTAEELSADRLMGEKAEIIAQNKYGFEKNTRAIDSIIKDKKHIPDGMTSTTIYEVKCVKKQGNTRQIKSYVNSGKDVVLIVDTDTKISKQLQKSIDDGKIKLERTDLKGRSKPKIKCK